MKAVELYSHLEKDFNKPNLTDDWANYMDSSVLRFTCENFKTRSIGVACDFARDINRVYTAVFPSDTVLEQVLAGESDSVLFVHHAAVWGYKEPRGLGFTQMNPVLLERMHEKTISVYVMHSPLDNFSDYSTSKTLADALGLEIIKPFCEYEGGLCGIIAKTNCATVGELQEKFAAAIGHKVSLYPYGSPEIAGNIVAIVAGGGNDMDTLTQMRKEGISALITGITAKNDYSDDIHRFEQQHKINLLGGTHYSTEKFACIAMLEYFKKLGLPVEFIAELPCLEDL